jgi:hypothetical protein
MEVHPEMERGVFRQRIFRPSGGDHRATLEDCAGGITERFQQTETRYPAVPWFQFKIGIPASPDSLWFSQFQRLFVCPAPIRWSRK